MVTGKNIVCISASDWDRPWGSKQQLMSRLSSANKVLYVEYQASFLHISLCYARRKKLTRPLAKINKNLFVFTPYPCLPFGYYFRFINKINQKMLSWTLKIIMGKIGFKEIILWAYLPSSVDILGGLRAKLTLYHCIADFQNEKQNRLRKRTIFLMERELVQKADKVLTLTDSLHKKFKPLNINTYLFQSAVDEVLFSNSRSREPADMAGLKRPRVGMVGYLDGKVLDVELLCQIADTHPGWSVILIGPKFRHINQFKNLLRRKNVYFLGEKQHKEVPYYISNLDVCVIPYLLNEFTNNVSPLKLYEYMAMGKPVVSTNLSSLSQFKEVIKISHTKKDFLNGITSSLAEDSAELMHKRFAVARDNSWDKRLQFISYLIEHEDKFYRAAL